MWPKAENTTQEAAREGSDFIYLVFESAPQTVVIVRFFFCLFPFLNQITLSYYIDNTTYKKIY